MNEPSTLNFDKKTLCLALGGSHSYGLSTPKSDIDIRGVFVNTSLSHLVGLRHNEVLVSQNEKEDTVNTEFRHFLRLLRGANTQMVELLFIKDYTYTDTTWQYVLSERNNLIDSSRLFHSLMGYIQSERRLANGERTGKLGGKRKESIDKYGFSPKNFVQLLRLAWAGSVYMEKGIFPVKVSDEDASFSDFLFDIKTQPEKYEREQLNEISGLYEKRLSKSYENRAVNTNFNEDVANELCLVIYGELIKQYVSRT